MIVATSHLHLQPVSDASSGNEAGQRESFVHKCQCVVEGLKRVCGSAHPDQAGIGAHDPYRRAAECGNAAVDDLQ